MDIDKILTDEYLESENLLKRANTLDKHAMDNTLYISISFYHFMSQYEFSFNDGIEDVYRKTGTSEHEGITKLFYKHCESL